MLAEAGDAPFNHPDWMWEPKLDGYRVLAFIDGQNVNLRSRRGLALTGKFHRLAAELGTLGAHTMILDGEIVAFDAGGKPSFNALQNRVQLKTEREIAAAERDAPVVFYCLDLLHFAGINLRKARYGDRRRYLAQCLLPSPLVQLVHASEDGIGLHDAALASGFEGVSASARTAATRPDGARILVEIKADAQRRYVVGGYNRGRVRALRSGRCSSATGTRQAAPCLACRLRL